MEQDPKKRPRKLWEPFDPKNTAMWEFMQETNKKYNLKNKVCFKPISDSTHPFSLVLYPRLCERHLTNQQRLLETSTAGPSPDAQISSPISSNIRVLFTSEPALEW